MFYSYVLINNSKLKTYSGHTNNLAKRLEEHNRCKSRFTSRFGPWMILYFEEFSNLDDAISREKYYKSCAGRKFIKKILTNFRC